MSGGEQGCPVPGLERGLGTATVPTSRKNGCEVLLLGTGSPALQAEGPVGLGLCHCRGRLRSRLSPCRRVRLRRQRQQSLAGESESLSLFM